MSISVTLYDGQIDIGSVTGLAIKTAGGTNGIEDIELEVDTITSDMREPQMVKICLASRNGGHIPIRIE